MTSPPILRHPAFTWGCVAALAVSLGFVIYNGATGQTSDALVWCAISAVAAGMIYFREALPPFYGLLIAVAAAVNGAGYTMTLWHQDTLFDEIVHAYTTFSGMAAIGWALLRSGAFPPSARTGLFWSVIGLGLVLGLLWEGFEMLIGIIGSQKDTVIDLVMDMAGATGAAFLACWVHSYDCRPSRDATGNPAGAGGLLVREQDIK